MAADPVLRILWKFGSGCGSCLADPVWNLATAERILSADTDGICNSSADPEADPVGIWQCSIASAADPVSGFGSGR